MDALNDNQLEIYNPFKTIDSFTKNLVYNQRIIGLIFVQFLKCHKNFNINQFTVPLIFCKCQWISLNKLKKDEWFTLTDEIINLIGYKLSVYNTLASWPIFWLPTKT